MCLAGCVCVSNGCDVGIGFLVEIENELLWCLIE
jgi:hypothetical protein